VVTHEVTSAPLSASNLEARRRTSSRMDFREGSSAPVERGRTTPEVTRTRARGLEHGASLRSLVGDSRIVRSAGSTMMIDLGGQSETALGPRAPGRCIRETNASGAAPSGDRAPHARRGCR